MKAKILILMILVVLFTIFVTQNTEVITINFFIWEFEASKIVLISLTGLIGLIVGFIVAHLFEKPKKEKKMVERKIQKDISKKEDLP
jgi:uncharacterized integral membrane protein